MAKYSYETIFAIPKDFEKDEFCGLTIYNRDTESFKGICIRNDKPYGNHIGLHTLCSHNNKKVPEGYKEEYKRVIGKEWKPSTRTRGVKGIFDHIVSEVAGPRDVGLTTYLYNKDSVAIRIADLSGIDWVANPSEKSMPLAKKKDDDIRKSTDQVVEIKLSADNRIGLKMMPFNKYQGVTYIYLYDPGPKYPKQTDKAWFSSKFETQEEATRTHPMWPYEGNCGILTKGFRTHIRTIDAKGHGIVAILGTDETPDRDYWYYQPHVFYEGAFKAKGSIWIQQGDIVINTSWEGIWENDWHKAGRGIVFSRGRYDFHETVRLDIIQVQGKFCIRLDCLTNPAKSNIIC